MSALCRLGLHDWYLDCALIASVRRCQRCEAVDDEASAASLAAERARIAALPNDASIDALYRAALGVGS